MRELRLFILAASALALAVTSSVHAGECDDLTPPASALSGPERLVTASDLVGLRDIGPIGAIDPEERIFSLSPDKSRIAFQMRRAELDANDYCTGVFVLDVRPGARPVRIDVGGEFIRAATGGEGFASLPSGFALTLVPQWSPDGSWVAYLRRDKGVTQLWKAKTDGKGALQLTHGDFDVEDFAWASDGHSLTYGGRPGISAVEAQIKREGQVGFLYDDRYDPERSATPWVRDPIDRRSYAVDAISGETHPIENPSSSDNNSENSEQSDEVLFTASGPRGQRLSIEAVEPGRVGSPSYIQLHDAKGREIKCGAAVCDGAVAAWWSADGRTLYFLKRESVRPMLELYRWLPGHGDPSLVLLTEDALGSCDEVDQNLVCAQETSTQPRRFVLIDLAKGAIKPLFDPNPEFARIRLSSAERLRWTNTYGVETFGDLVLPPDYRPGQRLPLIVVGYESRGFLRGGTGDEYPIQLYAARGYAVLSFQRPVNIGLSRGGKTYDEISTLDRKDWADRRSVESSLEAGVALVVSRGVADPDKVGLTGFSDGAAAAQFALVNSSVFKAVVVSHCCETSVGVNALVGPAIGGWLNSLGYPKLTLDDTAFWEPISLRKNVAKVRTPILMQLSDDEYLGALEDYTALKEQNRPVEMYVFPGEHHVKWQPAHREAAYLRSLDWFDFWLKDFEDADPAKASQYRRWEALRTSMGSSMRASPGEK